MTNPVLGPASGPIACLAGDTVMRSGVALLRGMGFKVQSFFAIQALVPCPR